MRLRSRRQPSHFAQFVDTRGNGVGESYVVEESQITRLDAHKGASAAAA